MWSVALFSAAASLPACASLHQHASPASKKGPVRLTLDNADDMAFTTSVPVSGEKVHPIMDTGSFELVLFEHGCMGCNLDHTYFDRNKAGMDFRDMGIDGHQSYGSGSTFSSAVRSGVSLDSLLVKKQMFWLAYEVEMNMYLDDSFGGIFGLGPPASALSYAVDGLKAAEDYVKEMGEADKARYKDAIDSRRQVVKLSRKEKPWLENVGVSLFSICLLSGTGRSGVLVLNDEVPDSGSWAQVRGEFWQVDLARTSIGETKASACTAIVDSGTSLIGAPSDFLESVQAMVEDFDARFGCQDLSQWPSFELVLKSGQTLTLDPTSYVMEFDLSSLLKEEDDSNAQAVTERLKKFMPHLGRAHQRLRKSGKSSSVCSAAMFSMDEGLDQSRGCEFVFGLPIFREYYISHKIGKGGRAEAMLFARGDGDCKLMNQTDVQATRKSVGPPLKVDPKKIRIPHAGLNGRRPQLSLGRGRE